MREREEGARQDVQVSHKLVKNDKRGFLGGSEVKNLPVNAGDTGLIPGLGRFHMPQGN